MTVTDKSTATELLKELLACGDTRGDAVAQQDRQIVLTALVHKIAYLEQCELAFKEHLEKTEYVQKDEHGLFKGMWGMHRDDCARIVIEKLRAELDRLHADGMPRDREELQKLLNDAHRKGNQEAHESHRLVQDMGLSAQGGEVPGRATGRTKILEEFPTAVDAFLAEASPWIGQNAPNEIPELSEIASRRLQYMLDSLACVSPAPHHPDTVDVPERPYPVLDLHGEPMRGISLQMYCRGWDDLAAKIRAQAQPATEREGA